MKRTKSTGKEKQGWEGEHVNIYVHVLSGNREQRKAGGRRRRRGKRKMKIGRQE